MALDIYTQPTNNISNMNTQPGNGPNAGPATRQGSGFTNLQRILDANKNNRIGQVVGQGIQNVASDVKGNIQNQRQDYQQKATQSYTPYQGGGEFATSAIADPTAAAGNQDQLKRFTTVRQGNYTGPSDVTDKGSLVSGAQNVQSLADLTNTTGGKQALLGTFFTSPSYSSGQRNLDTLLFQSGNQAPEMAGVRNTAAQTQRNLSDLGYLTQSDYQTKLNSARDLGAQVSGQLTTEQEAKNKALADKLAQTQMQESQDETTFQTLQNQLGQGKISKADAARLGFGDLSSTPMETYNLNLNDYLKTQMGTMPTSAADVASQEEAARINALGKLGGSTSDQFDLSKVNTYKAGNQAFDVNKFNQDVNSIKGQVAATESQLGKLNEFGQIFTPNGPGTVGKAQYDQFVSAGATGGLGEVGVMEDRYRQGLSMGLNPDAAANRAVNEMRSVQGAQLQPAFQNKMNSLRSLLSSYGVNPDTFDTQKLQEVENY